MKLNVELTRFRVKKGKTEKVDEWLKFLNENMKDVLITLEGEKMFVETIFREHLMETNTYIGTQYKAKVVKKLNNRTTGLIRST